MARFGNDMNDVDIHVGRMISLHRKAIGLTYVEFAALLDIPSRSFKKMEMGLQRISPKLLRKICLKLNIHPKTLFETMVIAPVPDRQTHLRYRGQRS